MEPHRIVLAGLPHLLRDLIVELLDDDPDWQVVGVVHVSATLVEEIDRSEPDVLIAANATVAEHGIAALLCRRPYMHVLAVEHDARSATVYQLVPQRRHVGELSRRSLAAVLDGAALGAPNFDDLS